MNKNEEHIPNLARVKRKILVLSGKGGVGKSTVAVNLAAGLAIGGSKTGLLDIDLHGPSVPGILNMRQQKIIKVGDEMMPVRVRENLDAMSVGFMLEHLDQAVICRGPIKHSLIKQFLGDVQWGQLDNLIIDCPPGTGDELLSIVQLIGNPDGAVVVTTAQQLSLDDVRKSVSFCRRLDVPILGVVENMSGFICPKCGEMTDIFGTGRGQTLAMESGVDFLGAIPLEPAIAQSCETGRPYVEQFSDSQTAKIFKKMINTLDQSLSRKIAE